MKKEELPAITVPTFSGNFLETAGRGKRKL